MAVSKSNLLLPQFQTKLTTNRVLVWGRIDLNALITCTALADLRPFLSTRPALEHLLSIQKLESSAYSSYCTSDIKNAAHQRTLSNGKLIGELISFMEVPDAWVEVFAENIAKCWYFQPRRQYGGEFMEGVREEYTRFQAIGLTPTNPLVNVQTPPGTRLSGADDNEWNPTHQLQRESSAAPITQAVLSNEPAHRVQSSTPCVIDLIEFDSEVEAEESPAERPSIVDLSADGVPTIDLLSNDVQVTLAEVSHNGGSAVPQSEASVVDLTSEFATKASVGPISRCSSATLGRRSPTLSPYLDEVRLERPRMPAKTSPTDRFMTTRTKINEVLSSHQPNSGTERRAIQISELIVL